MTEQETLNGAENRVSNASKETKANFYIGIEGGIDKLDEHLQAFAWIAISDGEHTSKSRTATFLLPPAVAKLIDQGLELGEANDRFFNKDNSKQKQGAVGLLTGDVIDRAALYEQAIILALIPFKNRELYLEVTN